MCGILVSLVQYTMMLQMLGFGVMSCSKSSSTRPRPSLPEMMRVVFTLESMALRASSFVSQKVHGASLENSTEISFKTTSLL